MNFGCPVPKVTRRGGGAALPYKRRLFGQIVAAAVRATEGTPIPVTVSAPHRHRRRPPHPPRCRPDRRAGGRGGRRTTRPHRRPALFRRRRLEPDRPAQGRRHHDPGAGERRYLRGRGRVRHDRRHRMRRRGDRPRPPGPALVVRRAVGSLRRYAPARTTHPRRGGRHHPAARRTSPNTSARTRRCAIRKHIAWYLHGLPAGSDLRRALALVRTCDELDRLLYSWIGTSRSRRPPTGHGDGKVPPGL